MSPERKRSYRPLYPDLEVFIKEDVDEIRSMGQKLISPFWAMSKLGVSYTPSSRDLIIAMLSQSSRGNELNFVDTPKGIRMYASNIDALTNAVNEIYFSTIDFFPKRVKEEIQKAFNKKPLDNLPR